MYEASVSPAARVQEPETSFVRLAPLMSRFLAIIVDLIFGIICLATVCIPSLYTTDGPSHINTLLVLPGFLITVAAGILQIVLLSKDGQTIGKKVLHIKIVDIKTKKNGGFVTNVLMRSIVNSLLGIIPFYHIVDILFIFREDRRCIHDFIAGTEVVEA